MNKHLFALFFIIFVSCSSDNEEEFYNQIGCDVENVSFSSTIDPIIDQNCKSCHFNGNRTGVTLVTYENIKISAESGELLGSIKHLPGYDPMPQGGKLDDCTIEKIETWINNGTPNN
jgi:hypothetical protein